MSLTSPSVIPRGEARSVILRSEARSVVLRSEARSVILRSEATKNLPPPLRREAFWSLRASSERTKRGLRRNGSRSFAALRACPEREGPSSKQREQILRFAQDDGDAEGEGMTEERREGMTKENAKG
jgi:hypothetical protein